MRDTRIFAVVLLLTTIAVYLHLPPKSVSPQNLQSKVWKAEIEKGERVPLTKESLSQLQTSDFVKESIRSGSELIRSDWDYNSDGKNDIILYKKVLALQGIQTKPSLKGLQVHRYTILNSVSAAGNSPVLDLRSDGIFEKNRMVIPVKTPVFAYHIVEEKLSKDKKSAVVFKVELLDSDRQIASEQIVIYWDTRLKRYEATNAFDPEKAF
ncbi:hypothetical protein EP331_11370 [bacterium]|nr:MAG: hypothetical protein EP331_11370 [bacterium]